MSLVLRSVSQWGTLARTDIARRTGLSRPAVTSIVAELMEWGYLTETDQFASSGRGRPRVGVAIARRAFAVVAVDLRIDRTVVQLVDLCGEPLQEQHLPPGDTAGVGPFVATLISAMRRLVAKAALPVVGVGVSAPSVQTENGTMVLSSPYLPLSGTPLVSALREAMRAPAPPISMADVAECAAIANVRSLPEGQGRTLAHIQLGAGAGLGMAGGAESSGRRRFRIGHLPLDPGGAVCTCGARGCLDAVAGFPAFAARTAALRIEAPSSPTGMREYSEKVAERAGAGDVIAQEAIGVVGQWAGRAAAAIINLLDPDRLTLGGYPSYLGPTFHRAFLEALEPHVIHGDRVVTLSPLGDEAPLRGAAILAMQPVLDHPVRDPGHNYF